MLKQIHSVDEFIQGYNYLFELSQREDVSDKNCYFIAKFVEVRKNVRIDEGPLINECVFELVEYNSDKCASHFIGSKLLNNKNIGDTITLYDQVKTRVLFSNIYKVYESPKSAITEKYFFENNLPKQGHRDLVLHTTGYLRGGKKTRIKKYKKRRSRRRRRSRRY